MSVRNFSQKRFWHNFWALSILIILFLGASPDVYSHKNKGAGDDRRKEWMNDMREFKHQYFKRDLGLTRDQEVPFFKAYDQMDDELIRIGEETRALERKTINDSDATDTELESAARTIFEQKKKEGETELKYFEEFSKILTKKQLVKLKETERRFNRALLDRTKGRKANQEK